MHFDSCKDSIKHMIKQTKDCDLKREFGDVDFAAKEGSYHRKCKKDFTYKCSTAGKSDNFKEIYDKLYSYINQKVIQEDKPQRQDKVYKHFQGYSQGKIW